jgi:hypothetical protein
MLARSAKTAPRAPRFKRWFISPFYLRLGALGDRLGAPGEHLVDMSLNKADFHSLNLKIEIVIS